MMDRRRTDAEGGGGSGSGGGGGIDRVVHRHNRTSTLTVVVLLQNLLVAACLVVTLYVYWEVYQEPEGNIHIEFVAIADITGNTTLEFNIFSNYKMDLVGNDKISIKCTGPYVLYMYACYLSLDNQEGSGILQLQVESVPVASIMMNASNVVCRGLHSIAYLKEKDQTSLQLYSTEGFKIKNVTVGLSYLLGTRCETY
ncbi:hypothetical protein GBF38_018706 [Nibea albiflora]|uniref:Uncharacterized protein n=1 Tax=Nibea albiflora TaxID=240163 RepID=A0ACB7EMU5_NIBAL|nr:hypothetical protein GBF38_018706 [Nibea albiflora]